MELLFQINIVVFTKTEEPARECRLVYINESLAEEDTPDKGELAGHVPQKPPNSTFPTTLYIHQEQRHFCFIKDIAQYAKRFKCKTCSAISKSLRSLQRHKK